MAFYDYECEICGNVQEERHLMSEEPEIHCNKCGGKSKKLFKSSGNFILKGDDWPSRNFKMDRDMTEKNKRMGEIMKERTRYGEAVTKLSDIKK